MKKEPLSIITVKTLLAVIIFTGVGTIIVGGGWLIGNYEKISKPIKSTQQQLIEGKVTVTTDKTEYEQGETVEITVRNNKNKSVYYLVSSCYGIKGVSLEKHKTLRWQKQEFMNYPKPQCLLNILDCIEINPNENVTITKVMLEYYDHDKRINIPLSSGKYRVKIEMGQDCEKEKDIRLKDFFSIYSNEFTIKEK